MDDPVLASIFDIISTGKASLPLLTQISELASTSEVYQQNLATTSTLDLILACLPCPPPTTESTSDKIYSNNSEPEINNVDMIRSALVVWLRLCRRETLNKSTANPSFCDLCGTDNVIAHLVLCMERYSDYEEIARICCGLVMSLASDSPERQRILGNTTVPNSLATILDIHAKNLQLSEMACRAIRNLSVDDEVAHLLVQAGCCEKLSYLLSLFPSFFTELGKSSKELLSLVEASIFAIINLSYDNDIATVLGGAGCCTNLISIVPDIIDNENICQAICWALRNLSTTAPNIRILRHTNIAKQLLDILRRQMMNSDTVQSAVWCLANLSCEVEMSLSLSQQDIAPLLKSIYFNGIQYFPDDETLGPISEAIIFAFTNLSNGPLKNKLSEMKQFQKQPIADSIDNVDQSADEVNKRAADDSEEAETPKPNEDDFIIAVDFEPDSALPDEIYNRWQASKQSIGLNGGCEVIVHCLKRYMSREAMTEACFRAISALCIHSSANQATFGEYEAVTALLSAIIIHRDVSETVYLGLRALTVLLRRGDEFAAGLNRRQLKTFDSITVHLEYLMKVHKKHRGIILLGCNSLLNARDYSEDAIAGLISKGMLTSDGKNSVIATDIHTLEEIASAWDIASILENDSPTDNDSS